VTKKQFTAIEYMLQDTALVIDRVYYDHKTGRVNFRAHFSWHEGKPIFLGGQSKLTITPDGKILNRV
jgi:hypothetical protein